MSNDKPKYKLIDIESNECIYCVKITGTELAWIYLHYVTQDNTVSLLVYNEVNRTYNRQSDYIRNVWFLHYILAN